MSASRIKERLRAALKTRGGTLSLLNVFKEFDSTGDGQLSWEEFCQSFRLCGLAAAPQEIRGNTRLHFCQYKRFIIKASIKIRLMNNY